MNPHDDNDPRRRLLLQLLGAGLLAANAPTAGAGLFGSVPRELPAGRSIYRMSGRVLVNGTPANMATVIKPADTVETGDKGEIVFVVGKDAYLLRAGSRLFIGPEHKPGIADSLKLLAGRLLSVFAEGPRNINANNMILGIRGTGVYIETDPEETYLCTCYGLVDLSTKSDKASRETIKSEHHDAPRYILSNADKGKAIRKAPFKNHTDSELMLIEALVGREPPFTFPRDSYRAPRRNY